MTQPLDDDVEASGNATNTAAVREDAGDRKEYTFDVDTSIRYSVFRWLSVGAHYRFEARKADRPSGGYVSHLGTIDARISA